MTTIMILLLCFVGLVFFIWMFIGEDEVTAEDWIEDEDEDENENENENENEDEDKDEDNSKDDVILNKY